jgi:uncharacterized protein (DUF1786 family)
MKILTVDIGTGTQDVFLFDSRLDLENSFKLILPSPTMIVHRKIQQATHRRQAIAINGVNMGGGPSSWAVENHLRAGLPVYSTPEAACTLNDDLEMVAGMGVRILSEDEIASLPQQVERLEFCDFNFKALSTAFDQFGVSLEHLNAVAVAVFDHGAAPPQVSDRQFRFDYLDERIRQENRLSAFAYPADQIPARLTRLQAVAKTAASLPAPLIVMDSAPAAVLGATYDAKVAARSRILATNIGNFHSLVFRLGPSGIEGVFEHHTGLLTQHKMEHLITSLADGSLTHDDVFNDHGHGALVYSADPLLLNASDFNVVVTGPRRNLLAGSTLKPYFAAPFGDMMIAGCIGLLAASADWMPVLRDEVLSTLKAEQGIGRPPWEIEQD